MTCFVISGQALLAVCHDAGLLFRAHDNLQEGILNILHANQALVAACRQQSCLIEQIFQIRAGETSGRLCNRVKANIRIKLLAARMYLQNVLAALHIRCADINLTVKTSRTQQRRIQNILTVGRCDDDDALVCTETVHLNQQLVQRLLALVVSAAKACASVTANRINLINKDNCRRLFLRLAEQVAHTRCADTDVQLYEVRTGDGQERNACFTGNRTRQQGFTGSRRAYQQNALWNARADLRKFLRIFQKFYDFFQLRLFLIRTCDILECHMAFVVLRVLDARLAKLHGTASSAISAAEHHIPEQTENHEHDYIRNCTCPPRHLGLGPVVVLDDAILLFLTNGVSQIIEEQFHARQLIGHFLSVFQGCFQRAVFDDKFRDLFVFKRVHNLCICHRRGVVLLKQDRNRNHEKDDDNGIKSVPSHLVVIAFVIQAYMSLLSVKRKCYLPSYTDDLRTPTYGRLRYFWS